MFSFLAESIVGARRDAVDDYADAVDAGHESTASLRSAPAESRAAATQQSAPPVESQGLVVEDMLKQAWNAEGSPFAGQPFDPSRVNFNGSSDYGGGAGSGAPGMMPLEPPEPPVDITPE